MKKLNLVILLLLVVLIIVITKGEQSHSSPIKIGYIGALSGVGSSVGEEELKAVRLAALDLNSRGGVLGQEIEIIAGDVSLDKMKDAASVTRKLISTDGVVAIVGPQWDEPAFIIAPIVRDEQIPMVGANNTADVESLSQGGPNEYFFSTWYDNAVGIEEILKFAQEREYKRVAIVRQVAAGFWQYTRDIFIGLAPSYGIEVVEDINVADMLANDYRTHFSKLAQADIDALFMVVGDYNQCTVLKQMKEMRLDVPLLSTEAAGDLVSLGNCPDLLENAYYSTPRKQDGYEDFATNFETNFGSEPAFPSAATAYDAVMVIAAAIEKSQSLEGPPIAAALNEVIIEGVSLPHLKFDNKGFVSTPRNAFVMYTTRAGEFVAVSGLE